MGRMPGSVKSEGMTSSSTKATLLSMALGPTARSHQPVPTSPTEPSGRVITGIPSIMFEPILLLRTAATPSARETMRLRSVSR